MNLDGKFIVGGELRAPRNWGNQKEVQTVTLTNLEPNVPLCLIIVGRSEGDLEGLRIAPGFDSTLEDDSNKIIGYLCPDEEGRIKFFLENLGEHAVVNYRLHHATEAIRGGFKEERYTKHTEGMMSRGYTFILKRGKRSDAKADYVPGVELIFEQPEDGSTGPGGLVRGDGKTPYHELPYLIPPGPNGPPSPDVAEILVWGLSKLSETLVAVQEARAELDVARAALAATAAVFPVEDSEERRIKVIQQHRLNVAAEMQKDGMLAKDDGGIRVFAKGARVRMCSFVGFIEDDFGYATEVYEVLRAISLQNIRGTVQSEEQYTTVLFDSGVTVAGIWQDHLEKA
jgi:hypothetical protein